MTPRIAEARYAGDYRIWLRFADGSEGEIDLESELWGPMFEPLRADPELFRQVRVDKELGTIVWPNGADMDPDVLHGDFEPAAPTTSPQISRAEP